MKSPNATDRDRTPETRRAGDDGPEKVGVYDRQPERARPSVGRATLIALAVLAVLVIVWLVFF